MTPESVPTRATGQLYGHVSVRSDHIRLTATTRYPWDWLDALEEGLLTPAKPVQKKREGMDLHGWPWRGNKRG